MSEAIYNGEDRNIKWNGDEFELKIGDTQITMFDLYDDRTWNIPRDPERLAEYILWRENEAFKHGRTCGEENMRTAIRNLIGAASPTAEAQP